MDLTSIAGLAAAVLGGMLAGWFLNNRLGRKSLEAMRRRADETVRNARREANEDLKEMKKEKILSEDEAHRGQDEVQKITDEYVKKVEAQSAEKEQEIMSF